MKNTRFASCCSLSSFVEVGSMAYSTHNKARCNVLISKHIFACESGSNAVPAGIYKSIVVLL